MLIIYILISIALVMYIFSQIMWILLNYQKTQIEISYLKELRYKELIKDGKR